jgi:hypothetical protein
MDNITDAIKIFNTQEVASIIGKVEELTILNAELEYLLSLGSNNEKLVDRKRELENLIREHKSIEFKNKLTPINEELEKEEINTLKLEYESVVLK